jgi:hypothetical protein
MSFGPLVANAAVLDLATERRTAYWNATVCKIAYATCPGALTCDEQSRRMQNEEFLRPDEMIA